MGFSVVRSSVDADQYRQSIRPPDSEFLVTSRGRFAGTVTKIDFHRLRMQCLRENLPRAWRVPVPPARSAIWFNQTPRPAARVDGIEVQEDEIGLLAQGAAVGNARRGLCKWEACPCRPRTCRT